MANYDDYGVSSILAYHIYGNHQQLADIFDQIQYLSSYPSNAALDWGNTYTLSECRRAGTLEF